MHGRGKSQKSGTGLRENSEICPVSFRPLKKTSIEIINYKIFIFLVACFSAAVRRYTRGEMRRRLPLNVSRKNCECYENGDEKENYSYFIVVLVFVIRCSRKIAEKL